MRNPRATRVRVMKCDYAVCNSVRAVFAGVLFTSSPVGWLELFSTSNRNLS